MMDRKEDPMHIGNGKIHNAAMLTIGCAIGAGTAILLAPQSGKKTRRDLLHLGKTAKNRCEGVVLDVGHKMDRTFDGLAERWQDEVHKCQQLADEAKHVIEKGKGYFQRMSA
jgi:gas vesicle protein